MLFELKGEGGSNCIESPPPPNLAHMYDTHEDVAEINHHTTFAPFVRLKGADLMRSAMTLSPLPRECYGVLERGSGAVIKFSASHQAQTPYQTQTLVRMWRVSHYSSHQYKSQN